MASKHATLSPVEVFGGVDTHKQTHAAAALDSAGRLLGTEVFPADPGGYEQLLGWLESFGTVGRVGVEGTGSYGAGLARHLTAEGIEVTDVNRPNRQMRRRCGKTDTVDAQAAARAALNGDAAVVPKSNNGPAEAIRVLSSVRRSAIKARTAAVNQIGDIVVTAPDKLRSQLEALGTNALIRKCAGLRPGSAGDPVLAETKQALRILARRYKALTVEIVDLDTRLRRLCAQANPALLGTHGVGPETAACLLIAAGDNPDRMRNDASFAALCGASPVEASSGRIVRHRLNRGGNRTANNALWRIAMVRLSADEPTKAYAERRKAEGKTPRETLRCLKRYIAREAYKLLTNPPVVPDGGDLRNQRTTCGLTLTDIATALNTTPTRLSQLERGLTHNRDLAERYQHHITRHPENSQNSSCQR